jgi:hypothetical protein
MRFLLLTSLTQFRLMLILPVMKINKYISVFFNVRNGIFTYPRERIREKPFRDFVPLCNHSDVHKWIQSTDNSFTSRTTIRTSRDSAVGIATRYGPDGPGIESRWKRDLLYPSRPAPDPSTLLYIEYRASLPEVKRPGRGCTHPIPSNTEVKERVELYLCSPSRLSWPLPRRNFTFTLYNITYKIQSLHVSVHEKGHSQLWQQK